MSFLCFILIIILPLFLSNSLPHLLKPLNNNRNTPSIIGILTQPSSWLGLFSPNEYSYIASSYIKALEASGAQVLPLKYDWDEAQMDQVFEGINGLLLPGGGTELVEEGEWTHYGRVGSRLIRKAIERNDNMEYFPVWGTCLGFELMVLTIAEDFKVLKKNFNSLNYSNSLQFIEGAKEGRLYGKISREVMMVLSKRNMVYFNHKYALDKEIFYGFDLLFNKGNKRLREFFNVLTITFDKGNKGFISSFEARKFPFYGVQFHPEKNAYYYNDSEWKNHLEIDHSQDSIKIMRYFMDFFVKEAGRNIRKLPFTEKELLIYNFYPLQMSDSFHLVYIFSQNQKKDYFTTVPTHTKLNFKGNMSEIIIKNSVIL